MNWPADLLSRDFRPSEVERITGYSQQLRRKWEERHFDFPHSRLFGGDPKSQWYSWVGVQVVGLFGRVMEDVHSSEIARAAIMVDPVDGLQRDGLGTFEHDWRHQDGGMYAICDLSDSKPKFLTSGRNFIAPARHYVINLSQLQSELFNRVEGLGR